MPLGVPPRAGQSLSPITHPRLQVTDSCPWPWDLRPRAMNPGPGLHRASVQPVPKVRIVERLRPRPPVDCISVGPTREQLAFY